MSLVHQNPLTIISPVEPLKLSLLQSILYKIQFPDIEANTLIPFPKIGSIHFARFVIVENATEEYPIQLVFSTDYDGEESSHIAELIREAKDGLNHIYSCCIGYNGDLQNYLVEHKVPISTFYNGHPGLSIEQIRQENDLRYAIAGFLTQANIQNAIRHLSAVRIKGMIAAFISNNDAYEWAVKDRGASTLERFIFQRKTLLSEIAKAIALLLLAGFTYTQICHLLKIPVSIGFLALFTGLGAGSFVIKRKLNHLENTDDTEAEISSPNHVSALLHAENFQVQNQLTHLVNIKQGSFRLRILKFVLGSINFLARSFFNKGELGSIPSIHFARWLLIDNETRLLFFSNYDGSWESYLGDFVDKASVGLSAVWSNTKNFPKTRNLIQEGARDEQHFKEWARFYQISTQVWYSAYKTLSVQNINNNARIRSGLFRKMNETKAQAWLDSIFYYKN